MRGGLDCGERERIETVLRVYCTQDTLAMLRLLEILRRRSERTTHERRDYVNVISQTRENGGQPTHIAVETVA